MHIKSKNKFKNCNFFNHSTQTCGLLYEECHKCVKGIRRYKFNCLIETVKTTLQLYETQLNKLSATIAVSCLIIGFLCIFMSLLKNVNFYGLGIVFIVIYLLWGLKE